MSYTGPKLHSRAVQDNANARRKRKDKTFGFVGRKEHDPDDRPQVILSARAMRMDRTMEFTGETVGNSAHRKMTGQSWARAKHGQKPVSTLTDHVTTNSAKWLPKNGPVTRTQA